MEIINYFPSRNNTGSVLGAVTFRIPEARLTVKAKVMRNTKTNQVFISMPSEEYMSKEGQKKYSSLVKYDADIWEAKQLELLHLIEQHQKNAKTSSY